MSKPKHALNHYTTTALRPEMSLLKIYWDINSKEKKSLKYKDVYDNITKNKKLETTALNVALQQIRS